ncbi:unnamed protein product [Peronospora farinosa]|uniref:Expansin-like EG45 domain-containing protein n=2 Tax=Peronospora farinosa TaxID=134698 RepID=A0AAV0SU11_9STRA|nr:unnamed protein product [Peronospora farinosa]CAI5708232.1 unnamed protein product [Peronospora farinosa]
MCYQLWLLTSLAVIPALVFAIDNTVYSGHSTPYTLGVFSAGTCSFMYDPAVGDYYAAINSEQWASTHNCGRCAQVSSGDTTIATTVYIVDECLECEMEDLGLSSTVLQRLNGDSHRNNIKWQFIDCPVRGNIEYCVNSLSNSSWLAVQPANFITGVAKMRINNQDVTMLDSGYYFLLKGGSNVDMSAVVIELISISGEVITDKLSLTAGKCTAGTSNFRHTALNSNNFDTFTLDSNYKPGHVGPADDTMHVNTMAAASSSDQALLVAPVVLAALGSIVAGAIAYATKRNNSAEERRSFTSPISTSSSPAMLRSSIAKM